MNGERRGRITVRFLLLCQVVASSSFATAAPAAEKAAPASEEAVVARVRNLFAATKAGLSKLEKVTGEGPWRSTEGNEMSIFHAKGDIKLVRGDVCGEMGRWVVEHYFDHGQLFFSFWTDVSYNHPMYLDEKEYGPLEETTSENRFYFDNGRMVRWLKPGNNRVAPASREFAGKAAEVLEDARVALAAAKAAVAK